jgi:hypothetical protein
VGVVSSEHLLAENEKALRDWLRTQPGGDRWWLIVKAGFRASYEAGRAEIAEWRASNGDLGARLNRAEYLLDEEQYENQRLRAGIEASAVECLSIAASAARSQGEPDSDIADATLRSLSRRAKAVRDHLRALLAEDGA